MTDLRHIKIALGIIIFVIAGAAVHISTLIVERQNFLREVSRYNVAWVASQAVNELHRLEYRIAAFGLGDGRMDKEEVELRLDVLHNRYNLLRTGDINLLTDQDPEQKSAVNELGRVLDALDPLVEKLDQPGNVSKALELLSPLDGRLNRLSAAANQFGGEQVAADQQQLLGLHWWFSALAVGLFLCGLALIVLLFLQNRIIKKAHESLRQVTEDLRSAKEVAEAASEAKTRFLANMSHELRTPLNAIIGFSEIIMEEMLGPIQQARYKEYIVDIHKSGKHMSELVSDVLTMAKLNAGRFELDLEPVSLRSLVEATVRMLHGAEIAKDREIVIEAGGDWLTLRADERAVRQMLLNLMSNAIKFSGADTAIRVACKCIPSGDIQLTVSDRGIGMSPVEVAIAVQPFQQVDNGLSRRYDGTGLGLSIVKGLIDCHGGELVIDSKPGIGSDISLIFPKALIVQEIVSKVA